MRRVSKAVEVRSFRRQTTYDKFTNISTKPEDFASPMRFKLDLDGLELIGGLLNFRVKMSFRTLSPLASQW